MRFESQVQVITKGGTRTDGADRVTVTGADSAMFVLVGGHRLLRRLPGLPGRGPARQGDRGGRRGRRQVVRGAQGQAPGRLPEPVRPGQAGPRAAGAGHPDRQAARGVHRRRLDRRPGAGGAVLPLRPLPADRLLSGRGRCPANLQGVWNNSTNAALVGRLPRQHQPADELLARRADQPRRDDRAAIDRTSRRWSPPARRPRRRCSARAAGSCNNETNPFGFTGVHDWPTAFWFPEAAAWLTQHLYDHYLFSGTTNSCAARAYPVMKDAAEFWLDTLVHRPA